MGRKFENFEAAKQLRIAAAMEGFGPNGIPQLEYHGDCINPRSLSMSGRRPAINGRQAAVFVDLLVRCRKCPHCLKTRSTMWTARAFDEVSMASRTWFGTLTKRPQEQLRDKALAHRWCRRFWATDFEKCTSAEQLRILTKIANRDLTTFFKRIRKKRPIRYLLVCELHKSGLPHWHLLLHEQGTEVPKRELEEQWHAGFSHWRLVNEADPDVVFYVCKYLAKDAVARVRASAGYGRARESAKIAVHSRAVQEVLEAQALADEDKKPVKNSGENISQPFDFRGGKNAE